MANRYSYQAYAQDSNTGATLGSAQVEVFEAGTSTPVTLYADRTGATTKTNPFNADAFGFFRFYAASQLVDIVVSKAGNSSTFEDVALGPAESLDGLPDPAAARTALQLNNVRNVTQYSQTEADGRFVNATGDDMTGPLNMSASSPIQDAGNNAIEFDGSGNVTLPGNLTVGGTATNVNTTNLSVDDPLTKLADGNTTDAIDIGFIAQRLSDNVAIFWDESQDEFALALTADDGTVTTVTIADYANLHVGTLAADDDVMVGGTSVALQSITLTAGDGLSGGGDLSAGRTFAVDGTVLRDADLAANGGTVPETDRRNTFTARQSVKTTPGPELGLMLRDDSSNPHSLLYSPMDGEFRIAVYDGIGGGSPSSLKIIYNDRIEWPEAVVIGSPTGGSQGAGTINAEAVTVGGTSVALESRTIATGDGLNGGGDLSADRTLSVDGTVLRDTSNLDALADVSGATPTDGQALVWNNTNGVWEPQDQSGASGGSGDFSNITVGDGTHTQTGNGEASFSITDPVMVHEYRTASDGVITWHLGDQSIADRAEIIFRNAEGSYLWSVPNGNIHAGYIWGDGGLVFRPNRTSSESKGAYTVHATEVWQNDNQVLDNSDLAANGGGVAETDFDNVWTSDQTFNGVKQIFRPVSIPDDDATALPVGGGVGRVSISFNEGTLVGHFRADGGAEGVWTLAKGGPSTGLLTTSTTLQPWIGTTGTDGNFTIGTDGMGNLYFENRIGGSRTVTIEIIG